MAGLGYAAKIVKGKYKAKYLEDRDGYRYKASKIVKEPDKTYWVCLDKVRKIEDNCDATAITKISTNEVLVTGQHSHQNRLLANKVQDIQMAKIKTATNVATAHPRAVMGDITSTVENTLPGSSAYLNKNKTVARAIQRARVAAKGYPKVPTNFDSLVNFPSALAKTNSGEPFLVVNEPVVPTDVGPNAQRLLVFMSKTGRDILASCKTAYTDGTFKAVTNTFFTQLYLVIGLTEMGKAVPCAFCLLPDKEKVTYLRVANILHDKLAECPDVKLTSIMQDYEKGQNNAH